jgi:hypothetical protein
MKPFNVVFAIGLAIAALILFSQDVDAIQLLFPLGTLHVLILAILAWGSNPKLTAGLVEGLHKAGFLHTLMALAAALVVSAHFLRPGNKTADLSQVLLPMGAALIPHVLGVWLGHHLSSRQFEADPALEENVFKKLTDDADAARDVIRGLYQERERALRHQIAFLQLQGKLLEDIHQRSTNAIEQGASEFSKVGDAARRNSGEIAKSLESLDGLLKSITATAVNARTNVDACRKEVEECTTELQDAVKVIRDTHKLHDAISDLLSQKLFRKAVEV